MWLHSAAVGARSPGPCTAAIRSAMSAAAASSKGCRSSCRQVREHLKRWWQSQRWQIGRAAASR